MANEDLFKSLYPELVRLVEKRKGSWTLTTILEWQDVASILMARLWEKLDLYDESRPLENWVNRVVTNALNNLERSHWYKYARPCICAGEYGGVCVFNTGGNGCKKTPSKIQCNECPMYATWAQKKAIKLNIASPVALEDHINESHSLPEDSVDVDKAKQVIDEKILTQLNEHEIRLYKLMYIDNLPLEVVGKRMKYKVQPNNKIAGYQVLLKFSRRVRVMAKEIIYEHELA